MKRTKPHFYRYRGWWAVEFPCGVCVLAGETLRDAVRWFVTGMSARGELKLNFVTGRYE